MSGLTRRVDRLEVTRLAPHCDTCNDAGNVGPYSVDALPPSPTCPNCGRMARRQHFVDAPQDALDAMFQVSGKDGCQ